MLYIQKIKQTNILFLGSLHFIEKKINNVQKGYLILGGVKCCREKN